jgi:hypothetical protein
MVTVRLIELAARLDAQRRVVGLVGERARLVVGFTARTRAGSFVCVHPSLGEGGFVVEFEAAGRRGAEAKSQEASAATDEVTVEVPLRRAAAAAAFVLRAVDGCTVTAPERWPDLAVFEHPVMLGADAAPAELPQTVISAARASVTGSSATATNTLQATLGAYLRLRFLDPEGRARPFPAGMRVAAWLGGRDGDARPGVVGEDGVLDITGISAASAVRHRALTLHFGTAANRFVVCERRGEGAAAPRLGDEPGADVTGAIAAQAFLLPRAWGLQTSDWKVTNHAGRYSAEQRCFALLKEEKPSDIGTRDARVELELDPHWQFVRFEYFDRYFGHSDEHKHEPVAVPPLVLDGFRAPPERRNAAPDTRSSWALSLDPAGRRVVQCLPWIVQRTPDGAAEARPDGNAVLRLQTPPHTFVVSTSATARTLRVLAPPLKDEDKAVGAPGPDRLKYYDLPTIWLSSGYFARVRDAKGFFAEVASEKTTAEKPVTFSLDDLVISRVEAGAARAVDAWPTDGVVVFHHGFTDRGADARGGRAGATYSPLGVYRPGPNRTAAVAAARAEAEQRRLGELKDEERERGRARARQEFEERARQAAVDQSVAGQRDVITRSGDAAVARERAAIETEAQRIGAVMKRAMAKGGMKYGTAGPALVASAFRTDEAKARTDRGEQKPDAIAAATRLGTLAETAATRFPNDHDAAAKHVADETRTAELARVRARAERETADRLAQDHKADTKIDVATVHQQNAVAIAQAGEDAAAKVRASRPEVTLAGDAGAERQRGATRDRAAVFATRRFRDEDRVAAEGKALEAFRAQDRREAEAAAERQIRTERKAEVERAGLTAPVYTAIEAQHAERLQRAQDIAARTMASPMVAAGWAEPPASRDDARGRARAAAITAIENEARERAEVAKLAELKSAGQPDVKREAPEVQRAGLAAAKNARAQRQGELDWVGAVAERAFTDFKDGDDEKQVRAHARLAELEPFAPQARKAGEDAWVANEVRPVGDRAAAGAAERHRREILAAGERAATESAQRRDGDIKAAAARAEAEQVYPFSAVPRRDEQPAYIWDYPHWTRLVVWRGNLHEAFDQRTEQEADRPHDASRAVGARAAVNWVDAVPGPGPVRPARTDRAYFSVQPHCEQLYAERYARYDEKSSRGIGRSDFALLRCCDVEGSDERAVVLQYFRCALEFKVEPAESKSRDEFAALMVDNAARRWNGPDGVYNAGPAQIVPDAKAPGPWRAGVRWMFQAVPETLAAMRIKVKDVDRPFMVTHPRSAPAFGTGEIEPDGFEPSPQADSPGWFTAAHEFGHVGGLPDEYGERSSDCSYGTPGFRGNLPGDPFSLDAESMMMNNERVRARHFWHLAEWLHPILRATCKVQHGAFNEYKLPFHPRGPLQSYAFWPVIHGADVEQGTRGRCDLFLYALGQDSMRMQTLPHLLGRGGEVDGLLIVVVHVRARMDLPMPGQPVKHDHLVGMTDILHRSVELGLNQQWVVSGTVRFDARAEDGSRREVAHTFRRCLLHFSTRFLVTPASDSAKYLRDTGVTNAAEYERRAAWIANHCKPHFDLDVVWAKAPDCAWQGNAADRRLRIAVQTAGSTWRDRKISLGNHFLAQLPALVGVDGKEVKDLKAGDFQRLVRAVIPDGQVSDK